jgi:hypothetical protein
MRLTFAFLLLLTVFIGCNKTENKSHSKNKLQQNNQEHLLEHDTIYNVELANKLWEKQDTVRAVVIDTACINQRERAKSDIKKGKLIYYHSNLWYEWKEMEELLTEYNIEFKNHSHSCFGPPPGFEYDCYKKLMWLEIDKRIGQSIIDSLWNVAERKFVLKYPDSLYIKDGMDIRQKYLPK